MLFGRFGGLARLGCFSPKNPDSGGYGGVAKGEGVEGQFAGC